MTRLLSSSSSSFAAAAAAVGSTTLPLLQGLGACGKSEQTILDALRHEEAPYVMTRAVRRWLLVRTKKSRSGSVKSSNKSSGASKKRSRKGGGGGGGEDIIFSARKRRKDSTGKKAEAATTATPSSSSSFDNKHHHYSHWWWTAFASYSCAERATATQMLLTVLNNNSKKDNNNDDAAVCLAWRIFPHILHRFQMLLSTATTGSSNTTSSSSSSSSIPLAPRLAMEWMALLEELIHIMVLKSCSPTTTSTTTGTTTTATTATNTSASTPSWNILLAACFRFRLVDIFALGLLDIGRALDDNTNNNNSTNNHVLVVQRQTQVLRDLQRVITTTLHAWLARTTTRMMTSSSTSTTTNMAYADLPRHLQTPNVQVLKLLAKHFLWNQAPVTVVAANGNNNGGDYFNVHVHNKNHHHSHSHHHHHHHHGSSSSYKWNALASLIGARFLRSHLHAMIALQEPSHGLHEKLVSVVKATPVTTATTTTTTTAIATATTTASRSRSGNSTASHGNNKDKNKKSSSRSISSSERRAARSAAAGTTTASTSSTPSGSGRARYLRSIGEQKEDESVLARLAADAHEGRSASNNANNNLASDDQEHSGGYDEGGAAAAAAAAADADSNHHHDEHIQDVDCSDDDDEDVISHDEDLDDDDDDDDDEGDDHFGEVVEDDADEMKQQQQRELERLVAEDRESRRRRAQETGSSRLEQMMLEEDEAAIAAISAVAAAQRREERAREERAREEDQAQGEGGEGGGSNDIAEEGTNSNDAGGEDIYRLDDALDDEDEDDDDDHCSEDDEGEDGDAAHHHHQSSQEEEENEEVIEAEDDEDNDHDDDDMESVVSDEDHDDDRMEIEHLDEMAAAAARAEAMGVSPAALAAAMSNNNASSSSSSSHHHHGKRDLMPPLKERQQAYVQASMLVMARQYPPLHHSHAQQQSQSSSSSSSAPPVPVRQPFLPVEAENSLLEAINCIVKPPKKPIHTKIIMRRAPTQEEFFRGSLSRNPISVDSLARASTSGGGGENNTSTTTSSGDSHEPTVGDLRQHIANDLQMADSAELIEIIIGNKILDMGLKLRVVHQVLWRKHLMENATSSSTAGGPSFFSVGSGLSMILSTTGSSSRSGRGGFPINENTPLSQLPPMIAMYRLAGVDGEATEDTVGVDDLVDPDAPASAASCSPEELQRLLEKDYGITRIVTEGRGIFVLLRSIQHAVTDILRRIRRDDVLGAGSSSLASATVNGLPINPSRAKFQTSPPCQGLTLLRHCSRLACNRKKLLQARAPTGLLTLLLDVLKSLEDDSAETTKSNPTADILQELIEVLASDISMSVSSSSTSTGDAEVESSGYESDAADASSMPMLLESIETIALSAPLRNVIAKLLPFLTYGQADLSRTLAKHFDRHIVVEALEDEEKADRDGDDGDVEMEDVDSPAKSSTILMNTFVQTAVSLPANEVCNSLRSELITCGFIDRLALFIVKDMPRQPPSWSPALWSKGQQCKVEETTVPIKGGKATSAAAAKRALETAWRRYFARSGIRTAFRILTGLCKKHKATQARVAMFANFLESCHWLEATSDSSILGIKTNGLGLLAETLLDEMTEKNVDVAELVNVERRKTRKRKKELAQERRHKALGKMSAFGPLAGAATSPAEPSASTATSSASTSVRGAAASILAPVLGLFGSANPSTNAAASNAAAPSSSSSSRGGAKGNKAKKPAEKPSWMAEMESMEDETGLTCAICQEGWTLQPKELLGLYAYVKKISIPLDQCGARSSIDGSVLLKALPARLPGSLQGTRIAKEWFPVGRAAGEDLVPSSSICTSSSGRRLSLFTTTVSAGNGIHLSCHRRARQADRNHPKAPKSEWEGAKLRNGRVDCNIILPLVSSRSSKVSLVAVDSALSEHQSSVANLLGATPKSMLWTNLYDTRFLLLRLAYGEALNADCGGGSLSSNCNLLFYQLMMADMFERDAHVHQPAQSQHARGLSAGFIAACALVTSGDHKDASVTLTRGIADAAPMACLTSILFHNGTNEGDDDDDKAGSSSAKSGSDDNEGRDRPHPNRRWVAARDYFLRGLVICAGRRHALRLESSGCWTSRNMATSRQRTNSYVPWEGDNTTTTGTSSSSSNKLTIQDFQHALRPMITYFAMMDQLSSDFFLAMEDADIHQGAERLVTTIEDCSKCSNIYDLLAKAKVTMAPETLLELLQKGMVVA